MIRQQCMENEFDYLFALSEFNKRLKSLSLFLTQYVSWLPYPLYFLTGLLIEEIYKCRILASFS